MGEGDLVLLTFGHNDAFKISERRYAAADGAFRQNMTDFANQVQAKGGIPVILSPVARRNWSDGQMVDSFPAYRLNAELAADQAGARFMDFTGLSMAYFEALGVESTKTDFMWLSLEEMSDLHPVYLQRNDENLEDNTHFKEIGACGVAWVVAQNLPNVLPETGRLFTPESQRKSDQADERPDAVRACAGEAQKRNAN